MSYQRRTPPVRVELTIEKFNELVEILNRYSEDENERIKNNAIRLKDKLLRYSIPREDEENKVFIDTRFFPNEATDIIYMLLVNINGLEIESNYYEELLKIRENNKKDEE